MKFGNYGRLHVWAAVGETAAVLDELEAAFAAPSAEGHG